jgi:hypothetical protein
MHDIADKSMKAVGAAMEKMTLAIARAREDCAAELMAIELECKTAMAHRMRQFEGFVGEPQEPEKPAIAITAPKQMAIVSLNKDERDDDDFVRRLPAVARPKT